MKINIAIASNLNISYWINIFQKYEDKFRIIDFDKKIPSNNMEYFKNRS